MFGNDVALLLGMIERGGKRRKGSEQMKRKPFSMVVLEVYTVQPAFVF